MQKNRKNRLLGVAMTTEFETRGGLIFGCRILNWSEEGACISVGQKLNVGETIKLLSPSFYARVMWYSENKAGLKFLNTSRTTGK